MKKFFMIGCLSVSLLFANENVVKTSELELFLFKIGFESLLKDVDITKDKTELNSSEIKIINEKIELIMNELYKKNRVLVDDSQEKGDTLGGVSKEEIKELKEQIHFLKSEIASLKNKEEQKVLEEKSDDSPIAQENIPSQSIKSENLFTTETKEEKTNSFKRRVATKLLAVYEKPYSDAQVIKKYAHNMIIEIIDCNTLGWCKLKNEEGYVRDFLIKEL